jgi:thiol-disulfide isomerase/thioredoxin
VLSQTIDVSDSAQPDLSGATEWINSPPLTLAALRGKVVLVDFWTYSCINCLRTLPYIKAWNEKYKANGLVIIGVHTPEFPFEKDEANHAPVPEGLTKIDARGTEAAPDADEVQSPETYVGYARAQNFASPGGLNQDDPQLYKTTPARAGPASGSRLRTKMLWKLLTGATGWSALRSLADSATLIWVTCSRMGRHRRVFATA